MIFIVLTLLQKHEFQIFNKKIYMKTFVIYIIPMLLVLQSKAQVDLPIGKNATIYIVRHAEKLGGEDPLLTVDGNKRSGDLMRTMVDKKIKKIFVSEFKRTQHTADSMHLQLGIDTVQYIADTSCNNLFTVIESRNKKNGSILIVSHSNIIQKIIYKLGITDFSQEYIPANEFDNLYIIRFKNKKPTLIQLKYGVPSSTTAPMNQ